MICLIWVMMKMSVKIMMGDYVLCFWLNWCDVEFLERESVEDC